MTLFPLKLFLKDRVVFWTLTASVGMVIFLAVYLRLAIKPTDKQVILRSTVHFGVDYLGQYVELFKLPLFGLFFLVTLFFILIKYKSKELDRYFFLSLPVSAIAFLSHQTTAIFVSIFFFWFCLIRRRLQEKALAFVCFLSMLATTSFWWIPYLGNFSDSYGAGVVLTNMLFSLEADYILQTVITSLLCLMVIFFFATYIRTNRLSLRDEFVFYFPLLLLAVLVFFRAVVFLPVLKHLSPDSYNYIFIFFSTYFFLRTNFRLLSYWLYSLMVPLILIASFTSVIVSVYYTPLFQPHTAVDVFTLDALEHTSGSFLIYFIPGGASYDKAYYSYAPIYLNLTTSYGWYSVPPKDYKNLIEKEIGPAIKVGDCNNIAALLRQAEASEVVTFNSHCTTLNSCGFVIRYSNEIACVYSVSQ